MEEKELQTQELEAKAQQLLEEKEAESRTRTYTGLMLAGSRNRSAHTQAAGEAKQAAV